MVILYKNILLPNIEEKYIHYERYKKFIESRPKRDLIKDGMYYEIHHVFPKSMGGLDIDENKIKLTHREHYIAHMILFYCGYKEMITSFHYMIHNHRFDFKLSAKQYKRLREERSISLSESVSGENNPFYGRKHTPETIEKLRQASTGVIPSEESRRKRGLKLKGVPRPQKVKDKVRNTLTGKYKGENSPNFGIKRTEQECKNISIRQTGGGNTSARKVKCIETHEEFSCMKDAAIKMYGDKTYYRYITRSIHKNKSVHGYTWIDIKEDIGEDHAVLKNPALKQIINKYEIEDNW